MRYGTGKIVVKISGNGGYKSYWLYLPSKIAKNGHFPFKENEQVSIEIDEDSLSIRKIDERTDFLRQLGIKDLTLQNLIQKKALENKDHILIIFNDNKYTLQNINQNSNRIAHGLIKLIKKLELIKPKISLMMRNGIDYVYCWFGAIKAGYIIIPIDIGIPEDMIEYIINDSDTELLILDYHYLDKFKSIENSLKNIKKVIIFDAPEGFNFDNKYLNFDLLNTTKKENPNVKTTKNDPVEIMYTQGSISPPKGVVYKDIILPAFNFGFELKQIGLKEKDTIYSPLPLSSPVSQFFCILSSLVFDTTVIIDDKFNKNTFWEQVQKYKPNVFCYLGMYLGDLTYNKSTASERNHSIEWAYGFGARKVLWSVFEKRFNVRIHDAYTLLEGSCLSINKSGSKNGKLGSVGKPLSIFDVKIINEDDKEIPKGSNQIGEIISNYNSQYKPYYYKKPHTRSKVRRKDGYDFTGDYGYMDSEGYLYYVDRKEGIIKKANEVIYTQEIEEIADSHPNILYSATVKAKLGSNNKEEVKLYAVRFRDKITYEELYEHLNRNLAFFMVPRYFEFIESMPINSGGNILKRVLKQNFLNKNTWDSLTKELVKEF